MIKPSLSSLSPMLARSRSLLRPSYLALAAMVMFCCIAGIALPIYVNLMDGQLARLIAFPAALVFALLLMYDRKITLILIIVTRASANYFLEFTRFSLGGVPIGVGGLINALVIMIAIMLVLEKPDQVPRKAYATWAPFLLVALAGILITPSKPDAIRAWLGQLSCFAIFLSAFHFVRSPEDFKKCVRWMVIASIYPCLFGFVALALHRGAASDDEGEGFRIASTFSHPNEFAFYLVLSINLVFYQLKTLPKKNQFINSLFLGVYMLMLFTMLVMTKTRSAWFACVLGFAVYAVFFQPRYLLYMAMLGVVALFLPGVGDRLADLGTGNQVVGYAKLNSFAWRVYLWQTGMDWMTPAHYLTGYGLNSFREYSPIFFPLAGKIKWDAHSVYVQILFELGAVGIVCYAWLYFNTLFQLKKMLKLNKLAAFTLIIIVTNHLISSASDNMLDYLALNWYLWFSAGIGCAYVSAQAPALNKRSLYQPAAAAASLPRHDISYR